MSENGISRICVSCLKSFHCTDGDYFCSDKCCDKYEKFVEEEIQENE